MNANVHYFGLFLLHLRRKPLEYGRRKRQYEEPEGSSIDVIPQKVLMQFISELPAGYRTVFNLYIFEEKSHKEIARLLGINEKSSASQLTRAKATLAAKVREWMKRND